MVDCSYVVNALKEIIEIPSVTGDTAKAIAYLKKEIARINPAVTLYELNKGALIAELKGKTEEKIVLDAHVDTLGAMVKEIKSNGRLKISPVGGLLLTSVESENCMIYSENKMKHTGVFQTKSQSVHVYEDARTIERKEANMEIRIDAEVKSADDVKELGIQVGDFIAFEPNFIETSSGFIKSRFLDDKVSVAILLGVIKAISDNSVVPEKTILFYFNNTEEVGAGSANGLDQRCVEYIAVDMGAVGDGQTTDEYSVSICAKDSSGPYSLDLRRNLVAIAQKYDIPYAVDIYPFYGSDASGARRTLLDVKTIVVGPGVDASHSYERTHRKSIEATAKLLYYYIANLK